MIAALSFILLPFVSWLSPQGGQYRGPEKETYLANQTPDDPAAIEAAAKEGYNRWEFWFEINKDILLRDRDARRSKVLDPKGAGSERIHIDSKTVKEEIFPLLKQELQRKESELVRALILAIGKLGFSEARPIFEHYLGAGDKEAKRYALLGLGLIDDRDALVRLVQLLDSEQTSSDLRAYTALAIGLRGSAETVPILKTYLSRTLSTKRVTGPELGATAAAVLALGMTRDPDGAGTLIHLYEELEKSERASSRELRCIILAAMGRTQNSAALPLMLGAVSSADVEIRRAAAMALGELDNADAVEPLAKILKEDGDVQTRGFAAVSLGRIGNQMAKEALREGFLDKRSRSVKSFCAIAIGLARDEKSLKALLELATTHAEEESMRGAAAVGLGFLGHSDAVQPLLKIVKKRSYHPKLRNYAAIALGLLRPEGILKDLLEELNDKARSDEDFLRGLVLALGLLGDPDALDDLIQTMKTEKRDSVRGNAALAIGMIRDKRAISKLASVLTHRSNKYPDAHIYAAVALGALGECHKYPLLSEVFFNANYRIHLELLRETMDLY